MNIDYKEVGKKIRARRKQLGLTQKQLAELVELSEGSVSIYESGSIKDAPTQKLNAFAKALNIEVAWIIGFKPQTDKFQLAKHLQKLGIKSSTNNPWTPAMVMNILRNEVYTGYIVSQKRPVIKKVLDDKIVISRPVNKNPQKYKGLHTAIISEDQFQLVQDFLDSLKPSKVPKKHKLQNPFASICYCKICGSRMYRRLNYRDHSKDYLACRNMYCTNVSSRIYLVENKIIEMLKDILKEQKTYLSNYESEIIKKALDYSLEIKNIDKQILELDKQFTKICDLLEKGVYSVELFESRSKTIIENKNTLVELKARLIEESKNDSTEIIKKRIPILEKCIDCYFDLDIEQRNELLSVLVSKIEYYKEKSVRWTKDPYDFELIITL